MTGDVFTYMSYTITIDILIAQRSELLQSNKAYECKEYVLYHTASPYSLSVPEAFGILDY